MKFWITVLIVIGAIFYFYYPVINKERQCYETSQLLMSQISSNVLNQRLTKDVQCSQSTETLSDLEICIHDATGSSTLAHYTNDTMQTILAIIRPYGDDLWKQKAQHNLDCPDSETYQLP